MPEGGTERHLNGPRDERGIDEGLDKRESRESLVVVCPVTKPGRIADRVQIVESGDPYAIGSLNAKAVIMVRNPGDLDNAVR